MNIAIKSLHAQAVLLRIVFAKVAVLYSNEGLDMTCPECKQMMQSPDTDYPYWFCFDCGAEVPDQKDVIDGPHDLISTGTDGDEGVQA